jgi:hypothetical protein
LKGLRKNKLEFMIQCHQQTTTIDSWPYYEFEDFINYLNERNEEEKKSREKTDNSENTMSNSSEMRDIMNMTKNYNPSNFKLPSI